MPKFIGRTIPGSVEIHKNAKEAPGRMKLAYSQAKLLEPERVMCSLDTTDRGGINSLAKRWYRWFAAPEYIAMHPNSTEKMKQRAAKFNSKQES